MYRRTLAAGLLITVVLIAAPAGAQFLAADLIYVPGAAHTSGEGDSRWRSDLFITNVDEEAAVDVAIVYLPSGLVSNGNRMVDRTTWLGGRDSDGFGHVNPLLADIPAGGTVVLRDAIGLYWADESSTANFGAFVVFIYEADTLEDDGSRELKNGIVNSRVYTPKTYYEADPDNEGEFVEVTGSFGQSLPGVPWYNLADPSAISDEGDFSFVLMTGAQENEDFRYNLGILNASDPLTTINIVIQPFQGNGEPFLSESGSPLAFPVSMPPLAHTQYNNVMSTLFGLDDVPDDTVIDVSFVSWSSGSSVPVVGLTAYGTMIDNTTDDPTAILPAFAFPYNIECQWPTNDGTKLGAFGAPMVSGRPLEIPSR